MTDPAFHLQHMLAQKQMHNIVKAPFKLTIKYSEAKPSVTQKN